MSIRSNDDLFYKATELGQTLRWSWFKSNATTLEAAGVWHRLSNFVGSPGVPAAEPAAGSGTPGAGGETYDNAAGWVNWPDTDPATKHLTAIEATCTLDGSLMVFDSLAAAGAISIASTGAKNVGTMTLPRYSGALAATVEAWLEITTAVTAGTPAVTMNSYTDQDGNTGQTGPSLTLPTTPVVNSVYRLPLAAGDTGVRSVETINVDTLGTSGVANVRLIRPLAWIDVRANSWTARELLTQMGAFERIYDGASVGFYWFASATTAPRWNGVLRGVYG